MSCFPLSTRWDIVLKCVPSHAGLAVLAGERGCIFINNDNSFKTLDGSINDCLLLPDGVHPNLPGTERLAKSLGVDKHARCVTSRPVSQNIQRTKKKTSGDTQPDHGSRITANSNRKVMRQTGSESSKRQSFRSNSQNQERRNINQSHASRKCYKCGESHNTSDCRVTCWSCGLLGHKNTMCRK